MVRKEIIDVPMVYELNQKGVSANTIADVLGVSEEGVQTILGALEYDNGAENIPFPFRKCA